MTCTAGVAELTQSLCLNLSYTLTGDIELLTNLFKCTCASVIKTETELDDVCLTGSKGVELLLDDLFALLGEFLELAQRWQSAQVAQVEEFEKLTRRSVDERSARLLAFAENFDEASLQQGLEHSAAVHRADVFDLGASDGLPVGDDGQGFQRGARQPLRLDLEEAANGIGALGTCPELPAARHLVQHDAAALLAIVRLERGQLLADHREIEPGVFADRVLTDGLVGDEEDGFEQALHARWRVFARLGDQFVEGILDV